MKVLFITDNYSLEEIEGKYYHRYIDKCIDSYQSLGQIKLLLPVVHSKSVDRAVDLTDVEIRAIDKENSFYKRFICRRNNKRIFDEEIKKADIIIGFVPSPVCDLAIRYAKKYNKVFVSVVIASAWDILWYHSIKGKIMAPISHFNTKRTIRNSDYVIYVTQEYLQRKYPTKGQSIGVSDSSIFQSDVSVLTRRIAGIQSRKDSKRLRLITIGAVNVRYKGQEDVIKAMAALVDEGYDVEYALIGSGEFTRLKKIIAACGLDESRFNFIGTVSHEDIFDILDGYDIYIQPSRTEGLPRAVVEAMSRGLATICTNVGGMPELVDADFTYKPGDIEKLIELIKSISADNNNLMDISVKNFNKSKEFHHERLKRIRMNFLEQIHRDIKSGRVSYQE